MSPAPNRLSETPNADAIGVALTLEATYKAVEAHVPWTVNVPAAQRAAFYAVLDGEAHLELEGESHRLAESEVAFVRPNVRHTLSDGVTRGPFVAREASACAHVASPARFGGDGAATLFVSGWFTLAPDLARAFAGADRFAIVPASAHVLGLLRSELAAPGRATEMLLHRLGDVLLVETLRDAMRGTGCASSRAPEIHRAVALLHEELATDWTVDVLARRVGMSRSTFATRFTAAMGEPPLRYLARVRLDRAARLLRETGATVAEAAALVGYDDAPAFSKAFKRAHGIAPSELKLRLANAHVDRGDEREPRLGEPRPAAARIAGDSTRASRIG